MIFISRYDDLKIIADIALLQYDLNVKHIEFLTEETNIYFKVETNDGELYALKLYSDDASTLEDNKAEIYFINRLRDIRTPYVLINKNGEGITLVRDVGNTSGSRFALYTWLDGEEHYGRESNETFRKLGREAALLHKQTMNWEIPADIVIKKWDKVFYYTDEKIVYMKPEYRHVVSQEDCELLDRLVPILDKELLALYKGQKPQFIHGDLNPWNVKFKEGEIRLFDFEDSFLGFPVHELSIILYFYKYTPGINYDEIKNALLAGYKEVFPEMVFSAELLDLLILARELTFMNFSLQFDEEPKEYASVCMNRIKDSLSILNLI